MTLPIKNKVEIYVAEAFPFSPPQGSDAWDGDVSAALVSWQ